ncbi:MAG TPA: methyltransferase domain-containing protein [Nitrospirae bacterium]|nr:methyltransferase domain-containing protein [Nitrospirota bacterium]
MFEKYSFSFAGCDDCKTIYMSPRPSIAVMSDYYLNSENYKFWAERIFPSTEAARKEKIHKPWLKRIIGYCEKYMVPKGVIVEVGPGFGTFASVVKDSNIFEKIVAIEPTPEMASACRNRGIDVVEKRIEDIDDSLKDVDVLVSFETIEHLFDPRIFLCRAASLLKKGGLLVLSCPNGLGFDISLLGPVSWAVDSEHVNLFNPKSLSRLVDSCGFETLDVETPGRLDAEFVREASLRGEHDLSCDKFLRKVLLDEWDTLGWPFQKFLAENGLSSHMWLVARKI